MKAAKGTLEKQDSSTDNDTPQSECTVSLLGKKRKTLEEDEEELFNKRAKLYRFTNENGVPKWKERGTGHVKLLRHTVKGTIRLLMRRDKTMKICANHYITPSMELKPSAWSKRVWVWHAHADFADESPKRELLAIRYIDTENAESFKAKCEQCRKELQEKERRATLISKEGSTDKVSQKPDELSVEEDSQQQPKSHHEVSPKPEELLVKESQGKPERHDKVSPKPEELLVKEDIQGELKSHEEHFMEEDSQEKPERQEISEEQERLMEEATQGEPQGPQTEDTQEKPESPEMEPESPEMETTQGEPESPKMEPESPEMEATQGEPQGPKTEDTQEEPESPEMEPESPEMETTQGEPESPKMEPESPEMETTQGEPESPQMEPESPQMEPESPEMEATQGEPDSTEMKETEEIEEEAEEQQ